MPRPQKKQRLFTEEAFILEVSEVVYAALRDKKITKAALARSLGTSKANITQLLDGSRNMTLRTLADIAFALDLEPHFELKKGQGLLCNSPQKK